MADDGSDHNRRQDDAALHQWVTSTLERQAAVLEEIRAGAVGAADSAIRCLWWLALRRQATRRLARMEAMGLSPALQAFEPMVRAHRAAVEGHLEQSRSQLVEFDDATQQHAGLDLGFNVAVLGKGGAGKSVISGTICRLLARAGRRVIAVDLDPNPGLAYSLGIAPGDAGMPAAAFDQHEGAIPQLVPGLSAQNAVERFSLAAPDGIRYLSIGKIVDAERLAFLQSRGPLFQILFSLGEPGLHIVGDLEAGTNTPFQRFHLFADYVLLVVGPSATSALTARRLIPLVGDVPVVIVANRWRGEPDHPGLPARAHIPFDPAVAEAERLGRAPVDHCPDSPGVRAIAALVDTLLRRPVTA